MDWRPLRLPFAGDPANLANGTAEDGHDWRNEEITFLIESAGWSGGVIRAALGSGMLRIEKRGDVAGLVLNGFAELNEHLLPGYRGLAAAEARRRKADGPAVRQQRHLMEVKNGELPLVIRPCFMDTEYSDVRRRARGW